MTKAPRLLRSLDHTCVRIAMGSSGEKWDDKKTGCEQKQQTKSKITPLY
jgi:hypothetical protein